MAKESNQSLEGVEPIMLHGLRDLEKSLKQPSRALLSSTLKSQVAHSSAQNTPQETSVVHASHQGPSTHLAESSVLDSAFLNSQTNLQSNKMLNFAQPRVVQGGFFVKFSHSCNGDTNKSKFPKNFSVKLFFFLAFP